MSTRLWVSQVGDHTFRIERQAIAQGAGPVMLSERDRLQRPIRRQPAGSVPEAQTIAERWARDMSG
jgi:hypothetical protein